VKFPQLTLQRFFSFFFFVCDHNKPKSRFGHSFLFCTVLEKKTVSFRFINHFTVSNLSFYRLAFFFFQLD